MILVVCAAGAELRGFARPQVDVVAVGVGPVEAALGTARLLATQRYEAVVNAGIGGGFRGRAAVGDAVIVTHERYVELGREDGGPLSLPAGLDLVDRVASDPDFIARFEARASQGAAPFIFGAGLTSATITTSDARAGVLTARYGDPCVESMEGFAVLRAAAAAGIRALEVRGISNAVGDRATSGWDFRAGADAAVRALQAVLDVVQGVA